MAPYDPPRDQYHQEYGESPADTARMDLNALSRAFTTLTEESAGRRVELHPWQQEVLNETERRRLRDIVNPPVIAPEPQIPERYWDEVRDHMLRGIVNPLQRHSPQIARTVVPDGIQTYAELRAQRERERMPEPGFLWQGQRIEDIDFSRYSNDYVQQIAAAIHENVPSVARRADLLQQLYRAYNRSMGIE